MANDPPPFPPDREPEGLGNIAAAAATSASPNAAATGRRPVQILALIAAAALFMEMLDASALATALPAMARSLNESPIDLKLAMTSYLLALAVALPASGWLADRFGTRSIFQLAILVFAVGSVGCGLSQNLVEIVGARVVQGIGGAMMVPVGRLIVLRSVPRNEIVTTMAWVTLPAFVAPLVGPLIGGFIATAFDWRWIFWINVPIAALGLAMSALHMPNLRSETPSRFDAVGFALAGFGLLAVVTGTAGLAGGELPVAEALLIAAGGLALSVGYVVHSRRHPSPLLDVTMFRIPTFRIALIGGLFVRIGVGGLPFLLPLLMQYGFGMTPFESGAVTSIGAIGAIGLKSVSTRIIRRFGFRRLILVNAGATAFFVALPGIFQSGTPLLAIYVALLVTGFVRMLQITATNLLVFVDVPKDKMSQATTISGVVQQISMSFGITAAAIVLEFQVGFSGELTGDVFLWPFVILGLISLTSVPFFRSLAPDAGNEVSGRGPAAAAQPASGPVERGA